MNMELLFFLLFQLVIYLAGVSILLSHSSVQAVLSLIIVFCAIAGLSLLFGAEFLAFSFLIIYVGAVAILFLFVVMMLNIRDEEISVKNIWFPLSIILLMIVSYWLFASTLTNFPVFYFFQEKNLQWLEALNAINGLQALGLHMFFTDFLGFLICGGILLIALLGAILITAKTLHERELSQF